MIKILSDILYNLAGFILMLSMKIGGKDFQEWHRSCEDTY